MTAPQNLKRSDLVTAINLERRIAYYIKEESQKAGLTYSEFLVQRLGIPDDYRLDLHTGMRYSDNPGEHNRLRQTLRRTILEITRENGGSIAYKKLLERIPQKMEIPADWYVHFEGRRSYGYHNKFELFVNAEHRFLMQVNIMSKGGRTGVWRINANNTSE